MDKSLMFGLSICWIYLFYLINLSFFSLVMIASPINLLEIFRLFGTPPPGLFVPHSTATAPWRAGLLLCSHKRRFARAEALITTARHGYI